MTVSVEFRLFLDFLHSMSAFIDFFATKRLELRLSFKLLEFKYFN